MGLNKDVHAPGSISGEFMLCGLAFDAFDSGDAEEPVRWTAPRQIVTCEQCRQVLDHVRSQFRGYRYTGD